MRVLLIDDDPALLANVQAWLVRAGVIVDTATNADDGLASAADRAFDVIVLDVMLGGAVDGVDVCRRLRCSHVATPLVMLTARDAVPDRVRGLEAGADDYLVKPFALEELEARIRAVARRHLADRSVVLRFEDVELDTSARRASVSGRVLQLTEKELQLLEYLLLARDRPRRQADIFSSVWRCAERPATNVVDVYAGRLRRKLGDAGSRATVVARKRQGYLLATWPASEAGASR